MTIHSSNDNRAFNGRIALVTGASRGIGRAVAVRLAGLGAHVVLVARSTEGLEATDDAVRQAGGSATLIPLDLTQHDLIDPLGAQLAQRFGRLDMLVCNAAILGELTPLPHADPKVWQQVIDTNLTANYRLIRSLHPLLCQPEEAHVCLLTCEEATIRPAYWGAYAVSKAGLEAMAMMYAKEAEPSGIHVHCIDPGPVATPLRAAAFPGENPAALPTPNEDAVVEKVVGRIL